MQKPFYKKPYIILRGFLWVSLFGLFFAHFIEPMPWKFLLPFEILIFLGISFLILSIGFRNLILGLLACLFLAGGYAKFRENFDFHNNILPAFVGKDIVLQGTISSPLDNRIKNSRAYFNVEEIFDKDVKTPTNETLLLITTNSNLNYGDKLQLKGKLIIPRNFQDFNYQAFLKRHNVQTIIKNPEISNSQLEIESNFSKKLYFLREKFSRNLQVSLNPPHDIIALGVLLGVKNQLPEIIATNFRNSGLTHLLVVSGTNVSILFLFFAWMFGWAGRHLTFFLAIFGLLIFVFLVGCDPPVVRAALMGGGISLARLFGSRADLQNIVLISAVLMGLWNPRIIQTDVGFFLSFFATLGIVCFVPLVLKILANFSFFKNHQKFSLVLAVLLAAQISVSPILVLTFGAFPLAGLLANIIAEPLVPLIMLCSVVSLFAGFLPIILAKCLSLPAFIFIDLLLRISELFGQIPSLIIPKIFGYLLLVIVFGILIWSGFSPYLDKKSENLNKDL